MKTARTETKNKQTKYSKDNKKVNKKQQQRTTKQENPQSTR